MNRHIIYTTIITACFLLCGCSQNAADTPVNPGNSDGNVAVSYNVASYSGSRASTRATDHGWTEFNENAVYNLNLFLVKDEKVTLHWHTQYTDDMPNSTDCDTRHEFVKNDPELSHERIKNADKIYLIANYHGSFTEAKGKTISDILNSVTVNGLIAGELQKSFIMTGEVQLTDELKKTTYDINIPLERVAAKIRVRLQDNNKSEISDFTSMILHYAHSANIAHRYDEYHWDDKLKQNYTIPDNYIDGSTWIDLTDITELHPENMTKENGHVYYSYPSHWFNLERNYIGKGCTIGHSHPNPDNLLADEENSSRVTIRSYDSEEPIIPEKQIYVIVQAPYNGKKYFYKVPINYRMYEYNDRQCFSELRLNEMILPLYRADRNHFYDVTAIIDRTGGGTPEEAINNPIFTATIAPLTDGGTFDYIYD